MTRFFGKVGFAEEAVETAPGVFENKIVEFPYFGNVERNARRLQEDREKLNNDITVSNSISIVADEYANLHFHKIRYVEWAGAKWKVDDVSVQRPRLLLRLGEVYTDGNPSTTPNTP
jgi:hypothetical protein